jgi:hypothetical protein
MRFWQVARWVVLIVFAVVLTVVLVRGPEDTWVRDAAGQWVAHGHPATPAPPSGIEPSLMERIGPALFLVLLMAGLAAAVLLSGRAPAGADDLSRGIRYFGAVTITCAFAAVALALAVIAGLAASPGAPLFVDQTVIMLSLLGAIAVLVMLTWHAYTTRKVLEAHYDLKRSLQLLQETLEQMEPPR